MVEYALTKANRLRLARAFKSVERVDIGIDCVIEGQMGRAFVDDPDQATAFMIELGLFCYFAGEAGSTGGRQLMERLLPPKLLMPSSPGWIEVARALHGPWLFPVTRCRFSSAGLSMEHLDRLLHRSPFRDAVQRIGVAAAARALDDPDGFVDLSAFDSAEDFAQRGIGFCLVDGDAVIGAAYSSLICSKGIEVSIFVEPEHRHRGVATALGSALVKSSLERNLDPHWDAANTESCRLAEKLGYTRTGTYEASFLAEQSLPSGEVGA